MSCDVGEHFLDGYFFVERFIDSSHFEDIVIVVFIEMGWNIVGSELSDPYLQFILHIIQLVVTSERMQGYLGDNLF